MRMGWLVLGLVWVATGIVAATHHQPAGAAAGIGAGAACLIWRAARNAAARR